MSTGSRSSNFELLRLFCVFGIIAMHSCSSFYKDLSTVTFVYLNVIGSVFNTGVSIFILISGYFGINTKPRKIFAIWWQVLFCSLISWCITSTACDAFSLKQFANSCLPILSNKYWFATSYLVLMIFAPALNVIADKMSKKSLGKIIVYCLFLFSILPTLLVYNIPGSGKGVLHFFMMYLIGRYIALYIPVSCFSRRKLIYMLCLTFSIIFALNWLATAAYNTFVNSTESIRPFSRDCSILIVIASILIFLIFRNLKIKSALVNKAASHVFCMYLMDSAFRTILNIHFNLGDYKHILIFPLVLLVYILIIMFAGAITDSFRRIVFTHFEDWIWSKAEALCEGIKNHIKTIVR